MSSGSASPVTFAPRLLLYLRINQRVTPLTARLNTRPVANGYLGGLRTHSITQPCQVASPHPALGQELMPAHTKGHPQITRFTAQDRVILAYNDRAVCLQPPMPPPGWSFASRIAIRVLPSLQHVAPSAAPAHCRSLLGLPQSPVLCYFQHPP